MITPAQIEKLRIVSYPDPILRKRCQPIETFGERLQALTDRMLDLMHAHRGVGLAAPQVGLPYRIFVWNPTGEREHDAVFINPVLSNLVGQEAGEEGCLSIDGVTVDVKRATSVDVAAHNPAGEKIHLQGEGLVARIWQHETDHLDGRLILDYQSAAEEIANRRQLKELEAKYKAQQTPSRRGRRSARR